MFKVKFDYPDRVFWKKILLIAAVIFLFFASATLGFLFPFLYKLTVLEVFFRTVPTAAMMDKEVNILALGVDHYLAAGRSDTIMVVRINPKNKRVKIVSIPRDTLVTIPGYGLNKINHAYAYGGPELSRQTLEDFLKVPIPYYLCVDVSGLEKIIDALGGIKINVDERMYYVDYAGGLYVNLYPGEQRLNGRDAVAYVRFRHSAGGDLGRIKRQQRFLNSLGNAFIHSGNLFRSPNLLLDLMGQIKTNLGVREILGMAMVLRQSQESGRIEALSLPGSDLVLNGVYYWQPDLLSLEEIKKTLSSEGAGNGSS